MRVAHLTSLVIGAFLLAGVLPTISSAQSPPATIPSDIPPEVRKELERVLGKTLPEGPPAAGSVTSQAPTTSIPTTPTLPAAPPATLTAPESAAETPAPPPATPAAPGSAADTPAPPPADQAPTDLDGDAVTEAARQPASDGSIPTPLLGLAVVVGLLCLAAMGWAIVRRLAPESRALARWAHAWREAVYRASGLLSDFGDWLRFSR